MILMSNKDMDTGFVAKAIAEHKLDPNPKTGFHAEPDYWQETQRWKRVVERYEWGSVLFISDRDRRANATIIAVGKLDLAGGRVSHQGGWQDINPGWYKEMAMELSTILKKPNANLQVPPCLGFRQPDVICDGGKNEFNKMEPACSWRDRCMALQCFAETNNRLQEDLLKGKSPEQIIQLTTRLLTNGSVPLPPQETKKPPTKPAQKSGAKATSIPKQPAAAKGTAVTDPATSQAVYNAVCGVANEVATAAGLKTSADFTKHLAATGDLYLVDRTENSDYISLYQARKPKPLALASFRIRARVGVLVQLPVPKTSPLLEPIVAADVREWKDGAFQSAVREVSMEGGARLEHIKHIIVAIVQQAT